MLDMLAAVNATAAFAPVSLSFRRGRRARSARIRNLTIWNVGTESDTFQISVAALGGNAVPELPYASVQLDPGASVAIPVGFSADGLTPGSVRRLHPDAGHAIECDQPCPYWYGVTSGQPKPHHGALSASTADRRARPCADGFLFRVTDERASR